MAMAVYFGRRPRGGVRRDHDFLSDRLAARREVAAAGGTRLDQRRAGKGKRSEAENSFLHDLASVCTTRRHPADAGLFLRNDRGLRSCVLAPHDSETAFRAKRHASKSVRRAALSCRIPGAATKRVAFGPDLGAALACSDFYFLLRSFSLAGSDLRFESRDRDRAVLPGGSLLLLIPSVFLGGADRFLERIGGGGIHRVDKFGGKSRRFFRADDDGLSGKSNAVLHGGTFVFGGESLPVRDFDACCERRTSFLAADERGGYKLAEDFSAFLDGRCRDRFSVNFGLGDGGCAFQEIEVAAFMSLLDVLHK